MQDQSLLRTRDLVSADPLFWRMVGYLTALAAGTASV